jgi:hypothetical protein
MNGKRLRPKSPAIISETLETLIVIVTFFSAICDGLLQFGNEQLFGC